MNNVSKQEYEHRALPTHVAIQEKPNECRFYVDISYIKLYGIILGRVYFMQLSAVTRNNI